MLSDLHAPGEHQADHHKRREDKQQHQQQRGKFLTQSQMAGQSSQSEPGGQPGDLYVIVRSRPDPRFERHGADLWRVASIGIPDAVLGGKIKVPTLGGPVEVKIPPGTQPDEVLRLRGKGLPVFGARMRGDINIRLQVRVPEKLSREEKELYLKLRNIGKNA